MKLSQFLLAALAALPLLGCAKDATATKETTAMNTTNKALVAYFSATGTTKGVTERLAAAIGADLFEIAPAQPYTEADLNWRDKHSRRRRRKSPARRQGLRAENPHLTRSQSKNGN